MQNNSAHTAPSISGRSRQFNQIVSFVVHASSIIIIYFKKPARI